MWKTCFKLQFWPVGLSCRLEKTLEKTALVRPAPSFIPTISLASQCSLAPHPSPIHPPRPLFFCLACGHYAISLVEC